MHDWLEYECSAMSMVKEILARKNEWEIDKIVFIY